MLQSCHPERSKAIRLRIAFRSRRTPLVTKYSRARREIFATEMAFSSRRQTQGPSTALGMTELVSVTVAVRMGMKLARGVRVAMCVDEVRAEQQRVVIQYL